MPTKDVQRFAREEISGAELVATYPHCACESTEPFDGGYGPIGDNEHLAFFVESKRHLDLTKEGERRRRSWAPQGKHLRNITSGYGHSVYRLDHATPLELRQGAEAGHREAVGQSTDGWRGIVGAFIFKAAVARKIPEDNCGRMCVVDTPKVADDGLEKISELSHADLLWSDARKGGDNAFLERRRVFEDRMRMLLAEGGLFEFLKDFGASDLTDLLPDYLKSSGQLGDPAE